MKLPLHLVSRVVLVTCFLVCALGVPIANETEKKIVSKKDDFNKNSNATKSIEKVNHLPKASITTTTTTTTTTTENPKTKYVAYDYYEYGNDEPINEKGEEKQSEKQSEDPILTVSGCPEINLICQQHCENLNYYSGYCDGTQCVCYGKL